ncbi:MAG TPA: FGGY-family carbohydrate kinase [Acidimicrobiia bacterium]|nr:FGGY-family carbohydrate kinase [Acidimicrobiia bacterium]
MSGGTGPAGRGDPGVLAVDVGTSGVRAAVVDTTGEVVTSCYRPALPTSPMINFVEFDPTEQADAALAVAHEALAAAGGPVAAVGITNQRASTILWDRRSGQPVGPGVGWQDLRTVGMCLALQAQGLHLAPNASATKLAFLLDLADADRSRSAAGELAFGTVDTWLAWTLSGGAVHVTDPGNAAVTGLLAADGSGWDESVLEALRIPPQVLPAIVDSAGVVAPATALPGAPPIGGLAGDQQASLLGQGCVVPGAAKLTLGTGGMLDVCTGRLHLAPDPQNPAAAARGRAGTIPIVAWRRAGVVTWGAEGIAITAGTAVEWIRDGLGLVPDSAASEAVAASVADTGGVVFVPALFGLGTPRWDYGARSGFFGMTRGTGRAEMVRAVLEGVAQRGADLLEAAEADTGLAVGQLRLDGGMSANGVVVQALADFTGRPVAVSPVTEATTLGAAYLAGLAVGVWADEAETAALFRPARVAEPALGDDARRAARARFAAAVEGCAGWVPELSAISF